MEMEWMESIIPIIYCQLNICAVGIRDRVRLMSINSWIEWIISHGQCCKEGWSSGFSVCPIDQPDSIWGSKGTYTLLNDPLLVPSSYVYLSAFTHLSREGNIHQTKHSTHTRYPQVPSPSLTRVRNPYHPVLAIPQQRPWALVHCRHCRQSERYYSG